ncbi:MAG: HAD family hydrolase [Lachnospiraceae bacterium]|nr:HAD family hydrolase [Lachnospiraceae bacterium]
MKIQHPEQIKLIVSDIDGTILPYNDKHIPEEIYPLIQQLHEKGIRFMIASGRDASGIRELFHPVRDIIGYVAGNGTFYVEGKNIIFTQPFHQSYIREFLDSIKDDSNLMPVIMTEGDYYIIIDGSEESKETQRMIAEKKAGVPYREVRSVKDIEDVICKLGIYQNRILDAAEVQVLRDKWTELELVCGGGQWLDVTQKGSNKGTAIEKVLEIHHWGPENLMTFGDNENDLQMLSLAKYGYAVAGAAECAKEAASFQCDSVPEVLRDLLELL